MLKKEIVILSGELSTSVALRAQLNEYMPYADEVNVYGVDDCLPTAIKTDLLIYSSKILFDEVKRLSIKIDTREELIAYRTISFERLDELMNLKKGEHVLVVNDLKETAEKVIDHLNEIGINDVNYHPHYSGHEAEAWITTAITPGLGIEIPKHMTKHINIGPRLFDFVTITKILFSLGLLDQNAGTFSHNYLSKLIKILRKSSHDSKEVAKLNNQLKTVLEGIEEGLIAIDLKNRIAYINDQFSFYFNKPIQQLIGKDIRYLISDPQIIDFCIGIHDENERVFTLGNTKLAFTRVELSSGLTTVTAKNLKARLLETERLKKKLIKKGHVAKYYFNHIIGVSIEVNEAKYIAKKLARSNLNILIEGESGTGKELFASAIHNESTRKDQAFLAINFSAFSDELIESELFGYEEGSFTGAKKAGKDGLFELANGGTIFLDEIGDTSSKMQAKLLRVLQEGEIMKIGGTDIKTVDIRVIAATNKDLGKMVETGAFREDLYYRLKMGVIELPPLRKRKVDIKHLIDYFIGNTYEIDYEAVKLLSENNWKGNIRELKSTIDYMKALASTHKLTIAEMPQKTKNNGVSNSLLSKEEKVILKAIKEISNEGLSCGRQSIHNRIFHELPLTENKIRTRLQKLQQKGFIKRNKGRLGTVLTESGEMQL